MRASAEQRAKSDVMDFEIDEELAKFIELARPNIKVIGVGGSGCNTLTRMWEVGIEGAELIAMNTDAHHLVFTRAHRRVLLGKKLLKGLGAGSNPEIGEQAAREDIDDIAKALEGADMTFITCGLGGGTGTGASPIIAEISKDLGALTVAVVTLPFSVEGKVRMEHALQGYEKLRRACDTVIVIPNDRLLEIAPNLPLNAAFKVADEVLTNAVKGIAELVTKPGLINLDFADVKTILEKGGTAMIGLGEGSGDSESRALDAVEDAMNSPLLDMDVSSADRALVNITGGPDMTLAEAELVVESVQKKISAHAHIIWGAMIDETMPRNTVRVLVVISGARLRFLEGRAEEVRREEDLGIAYIG